MSLYNSEHIEPKYRISFFDIRIRPLSGNILRLDLCSTLTQMRTIIVSLHNTMSIRIDFDDRN